MVAAICAELNESNVLSLLPWRRIFKFKRSGCKNPTSPNPCVRCTYKICLWNGWIYICFPFFILSSCLDWKYKKHNVMKTKWNADMAEDFSVNKIFADGTMRELLAYCCITLLWVNNLVDIVRNTFVNLILRRCTRAYHIFFNSTNSKLEQTECHFFPQVFVYFSLLFFSTIEKRYERI